MRKISSFALGFRIQETGGAIDSPSPIAEAFYSLLVGKLTRWRRQSFRRVTTGVVRLCSNTMSTVGKRPVPGSRERVSR